MESAPRTRKTDEELLAELQKKKEQLRAREQRIKARMNEKARKERTRRLIQLGAVVESALGKEFSTPEELERLKNSLTQHRHLHV